MHGSIGNLILLLIISTSVSLKFHIVKNLVFVKHAVSNINEDNKWCSVMENLSWVYIQLTLVEEQLLQ